MEGIGLAVLRKEENEFDFSQPFHPQYLMQAKVTTSLGQ
jgi:hypothetical protein